MPKVPKIGSYNFFAIYILKKEWHSCFFVLYETKHKGMHAIFQKKGEKGENIWKFGQKYTRIEHILKKGSLMCATIAHMKKLEYTLNSESALSPEWAMKLVLYIWWGINGTHTFIQSFQVDVVKRAKSHSKQQVRFFR